VSTAGHRTTETGMSTRPRRINVSRAGDGRARDNARSEGYASVRPYEMIAGEPAFNGHTAQAIIARVVTAGKPRKLTAPRKACSGAGR